MNLPIDEIRHVTLHVVLPAFVASMVLTRLLAALGLRGFAAMGGLAAGYAAANHFRDIVPWRPGDDAWHWLPPMMAAVMVAEYLARWLPTRIGWAVRVAAAGFVGHTLLGPNWEAAAFAAATLAGWAALTVRPAPVSSPVALAAIFLAAAAVLIHAHSARFTDLAAVIGFALFGVTIVSLVTAIDPAPAVAAGVVGLAGLMLIGMRTTFSEVPPAAFFLVGLSPVAAFLAWPLSGRWSSVARAVAVLIPAGIAVALAVTHESLSW